MIVKDTEIVVNGEIVYEAKPKESRYLPLPALDDLSLVGITPDDKVVINTSVEQYRRTTTPTRTIDSVINVNDPKDRLMKMMVDMGVQGDVESLIKSIDSFVLGGRESVLEPTYGGASILKLVDVIKEAGNQPIKIAMAAIATTMGEPWNEQLNMVCRNQEGILPDFKELDGTNEKLNEFLDKLGFPPLDMNGVLNDIVPLVEWVSHLSPKLGRAVESLLKGEVYQFYEELMWAKTGFSVDKYLNRRRDYKELIEAYYGVAPISTYEYPNIV